MRLFHFTAATESHLGSILRERSIRTTESNVSFTEMDKGPRVVWLTRNGNPKANVGWSRSAVDKLAARLTVNVPAGTALSWDGWARRHGSLSRVMQGLIKAAGGGERDWYVVERRIARSEIVELRIGEQVWSGEALSAAERLVDGRREVERGAGWGCRTSVSPSRSLLVSSTPSDARDRLLRDARERG